MLKSAYFILNPELLENEFQLVEVGDWTNYDTKEKLGLCYTVLFPKLKYEKVKVSIKAFDSIVTAKELEEKGQISVVFEGLRTWASLYNGRISVKAEAANIKRVEKKI